MKRILSLLLVPFLVFGVTRPLYAQAPPVETVVVQTSFNAQNVPASELANKIALAQSQAPAGTTVVNLNVFQNPKTKLYSVMAIYR